MTTTQPGHRANLLAGLRTGGVRSVSVPHTAGPQASFVVPQPHQHISGHGINYAPSFREEDEMDNLAHMLNNGAHISQHHYNHLQQHQHVPHTAIGDMNAAHMTMQQQQHWNGMPQGHMNNEQAPMTAYSNNQQELQLQMMQMELMRLQALNQLQQFTQYRHDNQQAPQTAYQPSFATGYTGQVPMTAAIGGKFGRRASHNPTYEEEANAYDQRQSSAMNRRSVFVDNSVPKESGTNLALSKSDSAVSWRNNSNDPAMTRDNAAHQRRSPLSRRQRPEPLELRGVSNVRDTDSNFSRETSESSNDSSSTSTKSDSEQVSSAPTTPVSGNSNGSLTGAREEASKKLFQGLGLGRPSIHVTAPSECTIPANFLGGGTGNVTAGTNRVVSQPIRQPRGPPASAEELSTKNFANRIRKQAIGGLGALLEARERREGGPVVVESTY